MFMPGIYLRRNSGMPSPNVPALRPVIRADRGGRQQGVTVRIAVS